MYNRRLDAMGIPLIYVDLQNSDGFFRNHDVWNVGGTIFGDGVNKLFQ